MTSNSLLLFGDYGTEVIRLSQLYDPTKAKYKPVPADAAYSTEMTYFKPNQSKLTHTTEFEEVDPYEDGGVNAQGKFTKLYWFENKTASEENGTYVPVPQTLVVVDNEKDKRWGQYTLLVVDYVDDQEEYNDDGTLAKVPTYESTLVPINFSGSIDVASRLIDYDNNSLMLYVEDINTLDGRSTQRLVPDRKLMMYGTKGVRWELKRVIEGIDTVISTGSIARVTQGDKHGLVPYLSAAGQYIKIVSPADYQAIDRTGNIVSYFDALGQLITRPVERYDSPQGQALYRELQEACVNRGEHVILRTSIGDSLEYVQIPGVGYRRLTVDPITMGEVLEFKAYEYDANDTDHTRLVFAAKVTAQVGTSIHASDVSQPIITGMTVDYGKNTSDLWEINADSISKIDDLQKWIKANIHANLTLDDGGVKKIDEIDIGTNGSFYAYGLEQAVGATVGSEFDVLFKYFPQKVIGTKSNSTVDARYAQVITEKTEGGVTVKLTPSPLERYFIRKDDVDDSQRYILADNDGHPTAFKDGELYFTRAERFSWGSVISRPHSEMLVSRKRVRIVQALDTQINKIIPIPVWMYNEYGLELNQWKFNFLVYRDDGRSPHLISTTDSENGSVVVVPSIPALPRKIDGTDDNVLNNHTLYFKPDASSAVASVSKDVCFQIQNWSYITGLTKRHRWRIAWNKCTDFVEVDGDFIAKQDWIPYGSETDAPNKTHRPFLMCRIDTDDSGNKYGVFQIPVSDGTGTGPEGFPTVNKGANPMTDNHFLREFYYRALSWTDTWAFRAEGDTQVSIVPTHFRIRSAHEDGLCSKLMPIYTYESDGKTIKNEHAYGAPVTLEGGTVGFDYPVVTKTEGVTTSVDSIVIVEFAYWEDGAASPHYLLGVPVEARYFEQLPGDLN